MIDNQSLIIHTTHGWRGLNGRVLLRVEKDFTDEIKVGEHVLYLDTSYRPAHHVQEFGTVVAPPLTMPGWHQGECEVLAGSRVRFHYHSICEENLVEIDGQKLYLVPYIQLYYIEHGPRFLQMLNDYCLIEPVLSAGGEEKTTAGLITNLDGRPRAVANRGLVRYAPPQRPGQMRVPAAGATILYLKDADLPLEVAGETLYVMNYQEEITATL